ncbi:MAG: GNAT family N-acetyltransferase [Candidatus Micrarchaeia archaeon]|jgi:ribosomal protein S18 acetylase RimI-like enzyme
MKIRKITRADLPALTRLCKQVFPELETRQMGVALAHAFANRVAGACLVAEESGKPIGAVFGQKKITYYPNSAYVEVVFISKEHRGKGIGKALLAASLAAMKRKGISNVSITVDGGNKKARSLYKKAGFRPFRLMLLRRF